jgi:hypothetical protein
VGTSRRGEGEGMKMINETCHKLFLKGGIRKSNTGKELDHSTSYACIEIQKEASLYN